MKSVATMLVHRDIRRTTTFVAPKLTVKVTRQRKPRANARQETFLVSIGTPNFLERRTIKSGKIKKYPDIKIDLFTKS